MSIKNCPICGEKLWADGASPDGECFIGMPTAGFCPKHGFFRWGSGRMVNPPFRIKILYWWEDFKEKFIHRKSQEN